MQGGELELSTQGGELELSTQGGEIFSTQIRQISPSRCTVVQEFFLNNSVAELFSTQCPWTKQHIPCPHNIMDVAIGPAGSLWSLPSFETGHEYTAGHFVIGLLYM